MDTTLLEVSKHKTQHANAQNLAPGSAVFYSSWPLYTFLREFFSAGDMLVVGKSKVTFGRVISCLNSYV